LPPAAEFTKSNRSGTDQSSFSGLFARDEMGDLAIGSCRSSLIDSDIILRSALRVHDSTSRAFLGRQTQVARAPQRDREKPDRKAEESPGNNIAEKVKVEHHKSDVDCENKYRRDYAQLWQQNPWN
jgi:hypothetical protein